MIHSKDILWIISALTELLKSNFSSALFRFIELFDQKYIDRKFRQFYYLEYINLIQKICINYCC